jgi:hypothetical protein
MWPAILGRCEREGLISASARFHFESPLFVRDPPSVSASKYEADGLNIYIYNLLPARFSPY